MRLPNEEYIHVLSSDKLLIAVPARYALQVAFYTLTDETTESTLWLTIPGSYVVND